MKALEPDALDPVSKKLTNPNQYQQTGSDFLFLRAINPYNYQLDIWPFKMNPISTILNRPVARSLLLFTIFAAELIAIVSHYEVPSPQYYFVAKPEAALLFDFSKQYWQLVLWVIVSCLLTVTPFYKLIIGEFIRQSQEYRWPVWFALHITSLFVFILVTSYIFKQPADLTRLTIAWFSVWSAFATTTFLLWLMALAPINFWYWLVVQKRMELLVGIILGTLAWMLIDMFIQQEAPLAQKELWGFMSGLTLRIVYSLIGLFYTDLVYEPESAVVGTTSYPVEITYACSGIEGISLIVVFLAVYLWLFRENLRFPQVFWLFPMAMIAIWLANSVRIALLIAVGSSISPEIAGMGFHAQAGWIAFTLISIGAIALTHHMHFFSLAQPKQETVKPNDHLSTALLAPFLAQMAALMLTSAFSSNFDWLYPARILLITGILYYYRKTYRKLFSSWNWQAPAIGVLVFIIWMLLESGDHNNGVLLSQNLGKLSSEWAIIWLMFRTFGSAIVIPLAEELAFRGYLLRKLIAKDYENVEPGRFSWPSFIISSLCFGLLHDRWFAGTLAGMGYAVALYRRGQVGDAVVAHITTNALIAFLVLTQGKWFLWG